MPIDTTGYSPIHFLLHTSQAQPDVSYVSTEAGITHTLRHEVYTHSLISSPEKACLRQSLFVTDWLVKNNLACS